MHVRIWTAIGLAAIGWGSAGVATRAALNDGMPPLGLVAIRSALAGVAMVAILIVLRRPWRKTAASWQLGLRLSIGNMVAPLVLITYAYRYASAGFVGVLLALTPVATATMAHFWLSDEPLHAAKIGALAVGFCGVAVLLSSGASGLDTGGRPLLAGLLTVTAVAGMGFSNVYAKSRSRTYDALALIAVQLAVCTVLLSAVALAVEGVPAGISAWSWALLVYMALAGGVGPNVLYYWVLRHVSATQASMIGYLVPFVALTTGILLLDERLQLGIAAGGLVILAGVVLTNRAEGSLAARRVPLI